MVEFMEKVSSLNDSEELTVEERNLSPLTVEERNLSPSPTRMSSAPPGASSIHLLHQAGGGVPRRRPCGRLKLILFATSGDSINHSCNHTLEKRGKGDLEVEAFTSKICWGYVRKGCFNSNCGGCYMAAVEDSHCLTWAEIL
ncbi:hypothetical protein RHMOL_Rhmol12G0250200 [Rhododendron molle]|uniref:Uncharacterized protein n=1 Tax=Rhododendron molle TaxID=49168 RepID=A0ACC0LM98_RHOML|nr:hypothetical protein RHMOL_Rhmol12G0250200 [Rhododendron molle]